MSAPLAKNCGTSPVSRLRAVGNDKVAPSPFERYTELEAAYYFAHRAAGDLRYCEEAGKWFAWDGKRWLPDRVRAEHLAHETAFAIAKTIDDIPDLELHKKRLAFAIACNRSRGIEAMMRLAEPIEGINVSTEAFDADQWIANAASGTIDLRTGKLHPHDRTQLLTKLVPIEYDPNAMCDRWLRFLDEIFGGDAETIDYVQRAAGYSLTGCTREQCFFVLHGSGRNGKSTLLGILSRLFGEYGLSTAPETFLDRKTGASTNDLARLRGARFVSSIETKEGGRLAESFVKAVTGNDRISARFLFHEFFDFEPTFKLWLGTNHKPIIRDTGEAIWRRVRLIPFDQHFEGERDDKELLQKLEAELPGILAWALHGCLEWQRRGLGVSSAVRDATLTYRVDSDVIGAFLDDKCDVEPQASATAAELYGAYKTWCAENGERETTQKIFGGRLTDRGYHSYRLVSGRTGWRGIGIRAHEANGR